MVRSSEDPSPGSPYVSVSFGESTVTTTRAAYGGEPVTPLQKLHGALVSVADTLHALGLDGDQAASFIDDWVYTWGCAHLRPIDPDLDGGRELKEGG